MKYRCTQDWKGSPDGSIVVNFAEDQIVEDAELGEDLRDVALDEGWIEEADEGGSDVEAIIEAIAQLDKEDESLWAGAGKPKTEAIEAVLEQPVSAAVRDEAWKQMQSE